MLRLIKAKGQSLGFSRALRKIVRKRRLSSDRFADANLDIGLSSSFGPRDSNGRNAIAERRWTLEWKSQNCCKRVVKFYFTVLSNCSVLRACFTIIPCDIAIEWKPCAEELFLKSRLPSHSVRRSFGVLLEIAGTSCRHVDLTILSLVSGS